MSSSSAFLNDVCISIKQYMHFNYHFIKFYCVPNWYDISTDLSKAVSISITKWWLKLRIKRCLQGKKCGYANMDFMLYLEL